MTGHDTLSRPRPGGTGAEVPALGRELRDREVLRRLLRLARPLRGRFALAALLGLLTLSASVGLLATSGLLISWAALQPPILDLMVTIVAVRAFGIARGVFRYTERIASHDATFRLLGDLRARVYERVERLAPAGLGGLRSGELLSRLVDDVDALQAVFIRALAPPVVAVGVLGVAVAVTAPFSPTAALVLAAGMLGGGAGLAVLARRVGRASEQGLAGARARLADEVVDVLAGAGELAALGRVDDRIARVDAADAALLDLQRAAAWRAGLVAGLGTLVSGATAVAVLAVGVDAVAAGTLGGVYLALVVLTALAAFEAVTPLPAAAQELSGALESGRRVFGLADAPDPVDDPADPLPVPAGRELALEGAVLRYDDAGPPALDGVDLRVGRGQRVALVGPSGAGKTTAVDVLLRFRALDGGRATLDGADLAAYDAEDVRAVVGLVEQSAHLFDTTVGANVRLGAPDATDEEVARVLRTVRLDQWVADLPHGLDTEVGEAGVRVSGGQRQRIALARALLRDTPLLVLDEPTADLDRVTAATLRRVLLDAAGDRGVLLVTHDLPEPEEVDDVVVLDAGRVIERGAPEDLLRRDGAYRRMSDLQRGLAAPRGRKRS